MNFSINFTIINRVLLPALLCALLSCAAGGSVSRSAEPSAVSAAEAPADRMVVYTALLKLNVKNLEESKKIITAEIKNFKGFITQESLSYIAARIPAESLDAFCAQVKKTGKVEDEAKTGVDITDQYRDDLLRLNSLKAVRDRYTALMNKAANVAEMLSIEKELERINSQIELLEGRKKYAEERTAYAAVTISISETRRGPLGWFFYGLYRGIRWLFVWD
jgi:hypothetical protein